MQLPKSSQLASRLEWRESAGSTNLELIQLASTEQLPNFTVYATANQVAGRGRSGRVWETPANSALAISVLLHPPMSSSADLGKLGWLPLIAGLAMSRTVASILDSKSGTAAVDLPTVGLKWPNDVLVNEQKICGVLTELVGRSVVIGAGINLSQTQEQLPIPNATSLALQGAELPEALAERFDLVLSTYIQHLSDLYYRFINLGLDAVASGVRQQIIDGCVTLGREVRAELPNGSSTIGRAATIDDTGRLVLDVNGQVMPLSAADIVHLRH